MDLRKNSDCFSLQYQRIGFYKREGGCLLRGTVWISKFLKGECYYMRLDAMFVLSPWRPMFFKFVYKNSVTTSQRTQPMLLIKTIWLMLFRQVMVVCFQYQMKQWVHSADKMQF